MTTIKQQLTDWKDTGEAPEWLTEEGAAILLNGYLLKDETPKGLYERVALHVQSIYPALVGLGYAIDACLWNGWIGLSSPIASNLGTDRGLPISCFGSYASNSVVGIKQKETEVALLSKLGGGTSICLDEVQGRTSVETWAKGFDLTVNQISQGQGLRRGSIAMYLKWDHPDVLSFLNAKDPHGDYRAKLDNNIAISFDSRFWELLFIEKDPRAKQIFSRCLELKLKTGSPYMLFLDNIQEADPVEYEQLGFRTRQSNLCAEIMQHTDPYTSLFCALSSLNIARYDEWEDAEFQIGNTTLGVIGVTVCLLDAVVEDFIRQVKGSKYEDILEPVLNSAEGGRAIGVGAMGLHSYYQQHGWAWGSVQARTFNKLFFKAVKRDTHLATKFLGETLGVPNWCASTGTRNIQTMAIAPTLTNSVLCGGISPGVEPIASGYYIYESPKSSYVRINPELRSLLQSKGKDTTKVWDQIRDANGSVQRLEFLSEKEKRVYRTAFEIDQLDIIQQAAERQPYIDQGQSINLFLPHDVSVRTMWELHYEAWLRGLKSLYYVRSQSSLTGASKTPSSDPFVIFGRVDCPWCHQAADLVTSKGLTFQMKAKPQGKVPEIYSPTGALIGGYEDLVSYFNSRDIQVSQECSACEG
jgi:ribonucleoside-diphosphate reductase alpha chain